MDTSAADWDKLADKALSWIEDTLRRVQKAQSDIGQEHRKVAFAACYCLLAAHEYVESAFLAMKARHEYAGLACCLPVAEMAITFYWCTYDVDDFPQRLKRWEAAHAERPGRGDEPAQANPAPGGAALPEVKAMLEELDRRVSDPGRFSYLYPTLYEPLSASARGQLAPGRYFRLEESTIVRRQTPPPGPDRAWIVLTACLTLVGAIYHFFRWDISPIKAQYKALIGD